MSQFMSMNFNPIALRTAKTPLILDRSECNKVKVPNRAACEPRVQIDRWMDGWMKFAILRPFQQYFSHIRTKRG